MSGIGADADRINVAFIQETSFGVTPIGPPKIADIRITSEGLAQENNTADSTEIRSDRQLADIVRTGISAGGEIPFELSFASFDEWFAASFLSDDVTNPQGWSLAVATIAADITIAADNALNQFQGVATKFAGYLVGSWIKVAGFATAGNNGFFKIIAKAGDDSTITVSHGPGALVNEVAGASVSITQGSEITNGVTCRSYTIEEEYTDLTNVFHAFLGMTINTMSLSTQAESIIGGSFGFMGQQMDDNAATVGDSANTAANENEVMGSGEDVENVYEGGTSLCVINFSVEIANNFRNQPCVSNLAPQGLGSGKLNVTGTVQAYFENATLLAKFLDFTSTSLAQVFTDSAGQSYIIDLPEVKFTAGPTSAGGESSDIVVDLSYTAKKHPTENKTIRMVRFP